MTDCSSLPGCGGSTRKVGEAFTMLTAAPGPDIAPYHDRQVVVLPQIDWKPWLDGYPAGELLRPAPAGTLMVTAA